MKILIVAFLALGLLTSIAEATCIQAFYLTPHASLRKAEGRQVSGARRDLQNASLRNVHIQEDGRFVVRGNRGREHIFEPGGDLITTIDSRSEAVHRRLLRRGQRRPAEEEEFEDFLRNFFEN